MTVFGAIAVAVAVASAVLALTAPRVERPRWPHPDAAALRMVVPRWSVGHLEMVRAACVALAAVVLMPFGVWPLAALAALLPSFALRWRLAGLRDRAASRSLDILRATGAALRSGIPLAPALRLALEGSDPLASDPFQHALEAFELNVPLHEALRATTAGTQDRRVGIALEAFALLAVEQLPAQRAATVIASVSDRLTFEARLADEVRARTGGIRAQMLLLALLVPALSGYLVMTMPGLAATLATPLGTHVLVPAAVAFEVAGIVASRSIVRGVAR